MYPVTNIAHTMIKQLTVGVNRVLLEPQTDHYAYKDFFENILNNDRNDGETAVASRVVQVFWLTGFHDRGRRQCEKERLREFDGLPANRYREKGYVQSGR